jgi:hypothetical protein
MLYPYFRERLKIAAYADESILEEQDDLYYVLAEQYSQIMKLCIYEGLMQF